MRCPLMLRTFLLTGCVCGLFVFPVSARNNDPSSAQNASPAPQISSPPAMPSTEATEYVVIPGPLRSFLRMAALSQKVTPEEVLPLLAHHIAVYGYEGSKTKAGKATEYLTLLERYIERARDMQVLAGQEATIRIAKCADAGPLLEVLGYKLRSACGPDTSVETSEPERAFITIDSGFPLVTLEETLRGGKPFEYEYPSSRVPLLFTAKDWTENGRDVLDSLVRDPVLSRLYWGLSQMEVGTRNQLQKSPGVPRLIPLASSLEYYGTNVIIRDGRVMVPGGRAAESQWKSLVGASPDSPGDFVTQLMAKDNGWVAAYFDALGRAKEEQQTYFTNPARLEKFYKALRGDTTSPGAAQPVFRPDSGLVILVARLPLDANGAPEVPGSMDAWKDIFARKSDSKILRDWAKQARGWKDSQQLVEGLFATSRVNSDTGPLQTYLSLSEIDRRRTPEQRLSAETVRLMGSQFARLRAQYPVFSEFPGLDNASITRFITTTQTIDRIQDTVVRADALGIFQSNIALWQVFARQGEIASTNLNESWQKAIAPFSKITSSSELYDAGHASLAELMRATSPNTAITQAKIIDLLAGPELQDPEAQRVQLEFLNRIRGTMDDQRLASLDTILALGDGLTRMSQASVPLITESFTQDAGDIRSLEMPRSIFTSGERNQWAAGYIESKHIAMERQTDLATFVKTPRGAGDLAAARGQLTPYLRDTLLGFIYAYYEPPGAQMLHNNPLLVRTHDFYPRTGAGVEQSWQTPELQGTGNTAGNGAHLAGSLAGLPYALAEVEQGFIVPSNVQALTWQEVTPELLIGAGLPRWWNTTRNELHAVALYQAAGEELLRSSEKDAQVREAVMAILADRMYPSRLEQVKEALDAGRADELIPGILPSETSYLAAEYRRKFPGRTDGWGSAGKELENLTTRFPDEVSWERISRDFGTPHPVLAQNYGDDLLNMKILPSFMSYPGRLLGESWESSNLYWGRLADEMGYAPVALNELVPLLTRRMIENIFATNFEDWPALLRAMRETGEEFRQGQIAALPKANAGAQR
jgi:hypothetical protein